MNDAKRTLREADVEAHKAWRGHDGEDLADKLGNLGDEARAKLGNLGDDIREGVGRLGDDEKRRRAAESGTPGEPDEGRPIDRPPLLPAVDPARRI